MFARAASCLVGDQMACGDRFWRFLAPSINRYSAAQALQFALFFIPYGGAKFCVPKQGQLFNAVLTIPFFAIRVLRLPENLRFLTTYFP